MSSNSRENFRKLRGHITYKAPCALMEDDWSFKNPKRVKAFNDGDETKLTKPLTIVTNKQTKTER